MQILSLGFHATDSVSEAWENYLKTTLYKKINGNWALGKYIFSLVDNAMVEGGQNYNLQIFFNEAADVEEFIRLHIDILEAELLGLFGNEVMLFVSKLHVIGYN
jgi:Domain of unknown function (DUF4286)